MKKILLVLLPFFFCVNLALGAAYNFQYGSPGDIPVLGDWDGNGTKTPGMYRPSNGTFYLKNSYTGGWADIVIECGPLNSVPLVEDLNSDGITDVGAVNPITQAWMLCERTPLVPVPVPPPDPPPPPPPPNNNPCTAPTISWDYAFYVEPYPYSTLSGGQTRSWCIETRNPDATFFRIGVSGLTMSTYGTFELIAPDGTVMPNGTQGTKDIVSMNGAGSLQLRAGDYPWDNTNIPGKKIPVGLWYMTITGDGWFKFFMETY